MLLTHIVTAEEDGLTLQQLLRGPMALSGRQTRIAKAQGAITVNAAPFFSNQTVRTGMVVHVSVDGYQPLHHGTAAQTDAPPLDVIYEDDALLAVFKPALLQCHPSPSAPRGSDTLENRVLAYLGYPAHPVHRLDSETTGIVLFAKLPFVQAHLQQQMQHGEFKKQYEAWCFGCPEQVSGVIDAPIEREHPDSFTRIVTPDGQTAISHYSVLKTLTAAEGICLTQLALSPVTGRTHQLRVHMAHIGCPLLGDARYASSASKAVSDALGLAYHQLSAVSIRFIHPATGRELTLTHPAVFSFDPYASESLC